MEVAPWPQRTLVLVPARKTNNSVGRRGRQEKMQITRTKHKTGIAKTGMARTFLCVSRGMLITHTLRRAFGNVPTIRGFATW